MLLQSRASRISDVLTLRDTDEIASSAPGAVQDAVARKIREEIKEIQTSHEAAAKPPIASQEAGEKSKVHYVTVRDGKAEFEKP
jgi:hypothetical protein